MNIPFVLEVGAISENITVTGEAPLLDTSSVSSAQTFNTRMVESLPMLSNMPIMLTRFAGGVNPNPNQNFVEQGTTPTNNYYRGGEPDIPKSTLVAARVDYNVNNNNRIFVRGSKNTFIEGVGDWTYEVPAYAGRTTTTAGRTACQAARCTSCRSAPTSDG